MDLTIRDLLEEANDLNRQMSILVDGQFVAIE